MKTYKHKNYPEDPTLEPMESSSSDSVAVECILPEFRNTRVIRARYISMDELIHLNLTKSKYFVIIEYFVCLVTKITLAWDVVR